MRRAHSILVVAGLAAVLGGCALLNKKGDPADASSQMVTVHIDNQNFYDATIYLRWSTNRRRLGSVTGHSRREFTTRWIGPELQVEVSLLAGGSYLGDRIGVGPGEMVAVEIPPSIDRIRARRIGR